MSDNLTQLEHLQRHITDNFASIFANVDGDERLDFMCSMYWNFEEGRLNCDEDEDTSIYEASAITVKTWIDANGGLPATGVNAPRPSVSETQAPTL